MVSAELLAGLVVGGVVIALAGAIRLAHLLLTRGQLTLTASVTKSVTPDASRHETGGTAREPETAHFQVVGVNNSARPLLRLRVQIETTRPAEIVDASAQLLPASSVVPSVRVKPGAVDCQVGLLGPGQSLVLDFATISELPTLCRAVWSSPQGDIKSDESDVRWRLLQLRVELFALHVVAALFVPMVVRIGLRSVPVPGGYRTAIWLVVRLFFLVMAAAQIPLYRRDLARRDLRY